MLQTISSFYAKISEENLFISANTNENYIGCENYCIAHHVDKTCFLRACKNQIILLGEIEELLHTLDAICFTYQHMDCLYTLFKYRFSEKIIAKSVFCNLQRAISFKVRSRGVDKMPSIAKEKLMRKKIKHHFMSALQKIKSTKTSGSLFAERVEKVKKAKFDLEVIKTVDCFLGGFGKYDSSLVCF